MKSLTKKKQKLWKNILRAHEEEALGKTRSGQERGNFFPLRLKTRDINFMFSCSKCAYTKLLETNNNFKKNHSAHKSLCVHNLVVSVWWREGLEFYFKFFDRLLFL